jgi:hypothetical protein
MPRDAEQVNSTIPTTRRTKMKKRSGARHARRGIACGVIALAAMMAGTPLRAEPSAVQTALSTKGLFARGFVDARFPDGTDRTFVVQLVAPSGVVTATPSTGGLDVAKPWASVGETVWGAPSAGGFVGPAPVCSKAENVQAWGPGKPGPSVRRWNGSVPTWTGTWFEASCEDGSGYQFYRFVFERGIDSHDGYEFGLEPTYAPLYTRDWGWGWTSGGAAGLLQGKADRVQLATVTVCGYRTRGARPDCYKSEFPHSEIVPHAELLTVEVLDDGS